MNMISLSISLSEVIVEKKLLSSCFFNYKQLTLNFGFNDREIKAK
jgi:hypothetical protein